MKIQNESIQLFNLPCISGVEVISGQNIINDFRRHIHKTYVIGIVEQGKRIITHPDSTTQVSKNEIFIINPGQVHSCGSKSPSWHSYKVLSVSCRVMQSIASQISEKLERLCRFIGSGIFSVVYKNHLLISRQYRRLFLHPCLYDGIPVEDTPAPVFQERI